MGDWFRPVRLLRPVWMVLQVSQKEEKK